MTDSSSFSVVLMRENGPEIAVEGGVVSTDGASPSITTGYLSGQCTKCGKVHILEGEFRHVATNERSGMGRERIFVTDHWGQCTCGSEMRIEVEYMEYPRNSLQPYQILPKRNVEYIQIPGFTHAINRAATQVREDQEMLRASVRELREMTNSGILDINDGTTFETALDQLIETVENTVLVLGSYRGANKAELLDIKEELSEQGYDAHLFEDLPEFPDKDLSGNVATAMRMVGFCIMVDREASGHIDEYRIAEKQRTILARLTPEDGGATRMIGGSELVDVNYIRSFNFDVRPQEKLDDSITWAEEMLSKRREAYENHYEWRE